MISIPQEWIDKVSREPDEDFSIAGSHAFMTTPNVNSKVLFTDFSSSAAAIEIMRRGWIEPLANIKASSEKFGELLEDFIVGQKDAITPGTMFRSTESFGFKSIGSQIATLAWLMHCVTTASNQDNKKFSLKSIGGESIAQLVNLSSFDDGPSRAKDWLRNAGISFVVNSTLPSMRLDGATATLASGSPMIALTLRYDRVDNFWFTLLHEIGHLKLHLTKNHEYIFLDNLDAIEDGDEIEAEANAFARDNLIPRDKWRRSDAFRFKTKHAVLKLADELSIHPAIIAGRLRHETGNYTLHPDLLGQDTVREQLVELGE